MLSGNPVKLVPLELTVAIQLFTSLVFIHKGWHISKTKHVTFNIISSLFLSASFLYLLLQHLNTTSTWAAFTVTVTIRNAFHESLVCSERYFLCKLMSHPVFCLPSICWGCQHECCGILSYFMSHLSVSDMLFRWIACILSYIISFLFCFACSRYLLKSLFFSWKCFE